MEFAGAPRYVYLHQEEGGAVVLSFRDSSTCEERYEYRRPNSPNPKWRNLVTYGWSEVSPFVCGFDHENIILKELVRKTNTETFIQFGQYHLFELRWYNSESSAGQFIDNSVVQFSFPALWEAKLFGRVNNKAGSPVKDVEIEVVMNDHHYNAITSELGTFDILIQEFLTDFKQELEITPFLETRVDENTTVVHRFLCPTAECTTKIHHLRHDPDLSDFEKQQQIITFTDITVVEVSGVVYVVEPFDRMNEDFWCPKQGVEVCLEYIGSNRGAECVETEDDGLYKINADYGSDVRVHVTYNDHPITTTFSAGDEYIYNDLTSDRSSQNFIIFAETSVTITVVAGTPNECDTPYLGKWIVEARPRNPNCFIDIAIPLVSASTGSAPAPETQEFLLGAQEYYFEWVADAQYSSNSYAKQEAEQINNRGDFQIKIEDVELFHRNQKPLLDLRNQTINSTEYIRYEFHTAATPTASITPSVEHCVDESENDDYFVVEANSEYQIEISYEEIYYSGAEGVKIFCGDVDGSFSFVEADEQLNFDGQDIIRSLTSSKVTLDFTPENPRENDYQARFNLRQEYERNPLETETTFSFYTTGLRQLSGFDSVILPRNDPLYILRDPPGDLSTSSLVQGSSIDLEFKTQFAHSDGETFHLRESRGIKKSVTQKVSTGACAGVFSALGLGTQIFSGNIKGFLDVSHEESDSYSTDESVGWTITAEETFTTASGFNGQSKQDMFLILTWNIKLGISKLHTYEQQCQKDVTDLLTWEPPDDMTASNTYAWISEHQIENMVIPELERLLDDVELGTSNNGTYFNETNCPESACTVQQTEEGCTRRCELLNGITRWTSYMTLNSELKSSLDKTAINPREADWIQSDTILVKNEGNKFNQSVDAVTTNRTDFDWRATAFGGEPASTDGKINQLYFDGGGQSQSYTFTSTIPTSVSSSHTFNENDVIGGGVSVDIAVFSVLLGFQYDGASTDSETTTTSGSRSSSGYTKVSFTLADKNIGDEFTVAVFQDTNGWLVFETVSGLSSCPHEQETIERAPFSAGNDVSRNPRSLKVFEDEKAFWEFWIQNDAEPHNDIINSNSEPLVVYPVFHGEVVILCISGDLLFGEREVYPYAGEKLVYSLDAVKPPNVNEDHYFFEIWVYMGCNPFQLISLEYNVTFIKRCPIALFETIDETVITEEVELDSTIFIITAVNDEWDTKPWPGSKHSAEELNIQLQYRQKNRFGATRWFDADPDDHFDFSINQTLGETDFEWDISVLPDGDYDLRFVSECIDYGPPLTLMYSEIWPVIVDWDPPHILPFPEPQDGLYTIGDELSFQFSEAIECDYRARIEDGDGNILWSDESQNLVTNCVNNGADGKVIFEGGKLVTATARLHNTYPNPNAFQFYLVIADVKSIHGKQMTNTEYSEWPFYWDASVDFITLLSMPPDDFDSIDNEHYVPVWTSQMATLLDISEDRLEMTSIGQISHTEAINKHGISLLQKTENDEHFGENRKSQKSLSFKIHPRGLEHHFDNEEHESGDGTFVKVLREELSAENDAHEKYPGLHLTERSRLSVTHDVIPLSQSRCENNDADGGTSPFIVTSASGFTLEDDSSDNFRLVLRTSINHKNIIFRFKNASNEIARFHYETHTLPTQSHYWNYEGDGCSRIFTFDIPWHQFLEDDIGGMTETDYLTFEGSLIVVYEYDENVITNELPFFVSISTDEFEISQNPDPHQILYIDDFYEEISVVIHEAKIVHGTAVSVDLSLNIPQTLVISKYDARGNENQHVTIERSWDDSFLITIFSHAHKNPQNNGSQNNDSQNNDSQNNDSQSNDSQNNDSQNFEIRDLVDVTFAISCHDKQLDECILFQEELIITAQFSVSSGTIETEFLSTPCSAPSEFLVENGGDMSHCEGTLSSQSCGITCSPGYSPRDNFINCIDGKWTNGRCYERTFSVGPGSFSEISRLCGQRGGHIATIKSKYENSEIAMTCSNALRQHNQQENEISEFCYIGLLRSNIDNSFLWIDNSDTEKYLNWDSREPSNFREILETHVVIGHKTEKWRDYGWGEKELYGVCQYGDCIPNTSSDFVSRPLNIEIERCKQLPNAEILEVSDGCNTQKVEISEENILDDSVIRKWIYSDESLVHIQTIKIIDSLPQFHGHVTSGELTIACGDPIPIIVEDITASDSCDGTLEVNFEEVISNSGECPSTITRKWTAKNSMNLSNELMQLINISPQSEDEILRRKVDSIEENLRHIHLMLQQLIKEGE